MKRWGRWAIVLVVLGGVVAFFALGGQHWLTFANLKTQQGRLQTEVAAHPLAALATYAAVYVVVTALSLPGALVLTLAGGALFGLWRGNIVVSLSSTAGATLAFLASRYVLGDVVRRRFGDRLRAIDEGLRRDGAFYLVTLRLIAVIPFVVINLLMGLTAIPARTYVLASWLGMVPGTVLYVNAGTRLGQLQSPKGILSPAVLGSFALLAVFPWIVRGAIGWQRRRRALGRHRPPRRFAYDLVVIGAGSGGLVAAAIGAALRAKVALIERDRMGGDCLNTGCVPSKALIRCARAAAEARQAGRFGVATGPVAIDFAAVMRHVRGAIATVAPHDSEERFRGLGVEVVRGDARIVDPWHVVVGERRLATRAIVVATGAEPRLPSIPGLAEARPLTSDSVWGLDALPPRLGIIGGGPIGCELAQAFARLGARVTVIHGAKHVLEREDADVAAPVAAALARDGVRVLLGLRVERVEATADGSVLVCGNERVACDRILVATGRAPRTRGFGLEELGVRLDQRGGIEADAFLRTSVPTIFACGDVLGRMAFTHAAGNQAWSAAATALFSPLKSFRCDESVLPWTTFTEPEAARVGLSEDEAVARGIPHEVTRYDIADLDRAIAEGEGEGLVKILTKPGRGRILGAAVVGPRAGEVIAEFALAMRHRLGLDHVIRTIHTYPTFTEAAKNAALAWKRTHIPRGAVMLERIFAWRRARAGRAAIPLLVLTIVLIAGGVLWWSRAGAAEAPSYTQGTAAPVAGHLDLAAYTRVLATVVDERGFVDYDKLRAQRDDLAAFCASLGALDPKILSSWDEPKRIAFWCNAYNALTLAVVLDHMPVDSIKDIKGVWTKLRFRVTGDLLTLSQIEDERLRRDFHEPRIHLAINCASHGCPPLRAEPYEGSRLDAQLDDQAQRFLATPERLRIDDGKSVRASKIFSWYGDDFAKAYGTDPFAGFTGTDAAVLRFIAGHVDQARRQTLEAGGYRLKWLDYDWSLNRSR